MARRDMTGREAPGRWPRCAVLRREISRLRRDGLVGAPPELPEYRPERACPPGCDCLSLLVDPGLRARELEGGALFVLEDWARGWPRWAAATMGGSVEAWREMLGREHGSLLCLRTPCSGDFAAEAAEAGRLAGLPVRWLDVDLGRLAAALAGTHAEREAP